MNQYARRRVAVIIPVYCAAYVEEALASVMGQHRQPDEVIVIDDGTPEWETVRRAIERWPGRITLLRQANRGAAAARNAGLAATAAEWVAFLDADDRWLPDFLGSQMAYLESSPEVDLVWADATIAGETPTAGQTFMALCPSSGPVTLESLLAQTCTVLTSTVVVRRSLVMEAGAFDIELRRGQDFDLWLRLAAGGIRAAYRHDVLAVRRVHGANLSGTRLTELERAIHVFDKALATLPMPAEVEMVARRRVETLRGQMACERGKKELIAGEFAQALRSLDLAHKQTPNWKLLAARFGLRVAPRVLRRLYSRGVDVAPATTSMRLAR